MNHEHCIEICNGLLRGERSAVETYGIAVKKYAENPDISAELDRIGGEHAVAVRELEANVRSMGGTPDDSSGAWGTIATAVQSVANLFGAGSALESLQQGEKSGQTDYENALGDVEVMAECKNLIRTKLLPPVQKHIATLESLQANG